MNWTARCVGALCALVLAVPLAHAQIRPNRHYPGYPPPPRIAPDAYGPGIYWPCPDGTFLGPSYYLQPPFAPFQGLLPQMQRGPSGSFVPMAPRLPPSGGPFGLFGGQQGTPAFPTHPYARSPRDFFMWGEAQQDLHTRERPPVLVP
jgi:hypothetical protein